MNSLSRRSFLQGSSLPFVAALLPRLAGADELGAGHGAAFDTAMAVADALFRGLDAEFPAVENTHFRREFVHFLSTLDATSRSDLDLLLRVVEYSPPFLLYASRRFTSMTTDQRREFLAAWPDHWLPPIRMAARALKLIFAPLYFTDDRTWAPLGYDGPWIGRVSIPYFEIPPVTDLPPIDKVLP
jgi:hypothetical protein